MYHANNAVVVVNLNSGPQASSSEKRSLYDIMGSIAQFYRNQLKQPTSKVAIEYLKDRGLSGEIVQKFGIGYVADEWDLVRKNFGQNKDNQDMLVTGGMLIENDKGNRYDRFRGRIMFPIRDRRGRVIGFGGRVLGDGTPKYLNSPETPIFHKGKELYGLYEVLQAYREPPRILVVEGYMECCRVGAIWRRLLCRLFGHVNHWRPHSNAV